MKIVEITEEIYGETVNVVKVSNETTERFWTEGRIRQSCMLIPSLFTVCKLGRENQIGTAGQRVIEKNMVSGICRQRGVIGNEAIGLKEMRKTLVRYLKK